MQENVSLYEKSQAARFGFTVQEFCDLLKEVSYGSVESLQLDDLVLARACAGGSETAWDRFLSLYRGKLYGMAAAIAKEESTAHELADSLYADLFGMRTGSDGRRVSKLESYLGRGSLEGWLRTVLAQEYVNRFRKGRKLVAFDESIGGRISASMEPEAGNAELAKAVDLALSRLSSEERFLLAAYYLDGRTLAEIGRMLNVHESTVSRRIEKITMTLRKKVVMDLRAAGISKQVAEEMLAADIRDLPVDVRKHLTQERQA